MDISINLSERYMYNEIVPHTIHKKKRNNAIQIHHHPADTTWITLNATIKNNKHKLLTFYRDTKEVIVVQYGLAKNSRRRK